MAHRERNTYLRDDEIIERARAYLGDVQRVLEERSRDDRESERVRMILDVFASQQRRLVDSIERFAEDLPDNARDTYSQYVLDVPEHAPALPQPVAADDLTSWLLKANQSVHDMFRELAEKAENPPIGQLFGGLASQIDGHNRRISQETNRFRDL
jgi:rubrerythrin